MTDKYIPVTLWLTPKQKEKLEKLAKSRKVSMSEIVRQLID